MTDEERQVQQREQEEQDRVRDERNKEAKEHIRHHDELKQESRAYQEGGWFYRPLG